MWAVEEHSQQKKKKKEKRNELWLWQNVYDWWHSYTSVMSNEISTVSWMWQTIACDWPNWSTETFRDIRNLILFVHQNLRFYICIFRLILSLIANFISLIHLLFLFLQICISRLSVTIANSRSRKLSSLHRKMDETNFNSFITI